MKQPLTEIEQQALDFIVAYIEKKKYPPTVREITAGVGRTSPQTGQTLVLALAKKGYLVAEGSPRALRVLA